MASYNVLLVCAATRVGEVMTLASSWYESAQIAEQALNLITTAEIEEFMAGVLDEARA